MAIALKSGDARPFAGSMKNVSLSPTAPCNSSIDTSIAAEVIVEARATLAALPTGEWRRSMRARLTDLEGAVGRWALSPPAEDERRRVTAVAIDFFSDIIASR